MNVIMRAVDSLRPYERNAKKHDEKQIANVARSIEKYGWRQPLVIDRDGVIVIGHCRYLAAMRLGQAEVPVVMADDLTDEEIRELRIIDNKTNESPWDFGTLTEELVDLDFSGFELDLGGTDEPESADEVVEDEYDEQPPEEPRAQRGDIWICGDHRVMCGDSTSKENMDALMDVPPVFVFTDPPYGVAIGDKNATLNSVQKAGRCTTNIAGDTLPTDELYSMLVAAMGNLREHCDEGCSYYVSAPQGGDLGMMMMMMMRDAGLKVRHNLIWIKNSATFSLGRLDYDYQHEPIFYTWTKRHTFYGGYSTTVIDDSKPVDKMSKPELKELVRALLEQHPSSVVYSDKPMACDLHPTMKPVKLVARFMVNSSQKGDVCGDIFGGSGTTMIAAEQLGRRARLMELDPHYVDVIVARWEKFTGRTAELLRR